MSRIDKRYTDISCKILQETEKAFRVSMIPPGEKEEAEWFVPKSCIKDVDQVKVDMDKAQDIEIAEWFADKEGMV